MSIESLYSGGGGIALGVVAFAIVAILGVMPIGLQSSHTAQDQTRATQIARQIFSSFASQAQKQFNAVALPVSTPAPVIDLSSSSTTYQSPAAFLYVDNNGQLSQSSSGATYSVSIATNSAPTGFNTSDANQVSIRIVSPPLTAAGASPNNNQNVRDFSRVISKY